MSQMIEKEKRIREGDIFTLTQCNDEFSYGVVLYTGFLRDQDYICGFLLENQSLEDFTFMFPGIKFYIAFHGCYLQVRYDLEKDKLVSAIMTSNFHANDSVFADLTEEADSFMDSMVALEAKITQTMQESKVHQKVKM